MTNGGVPSLGGVQKVMRIEILAATLLFVLIALMSCATQPTQKPAIKTFSYRGSDGAYGDTGILISADENKTFIMVASSFDHFIFALPYFDRWDFTIERGSQQRILKGQGSFYFVSLMMEEYDISPEEQLEFILNQMPRESYDSYNLINLGDQLILRTEIDAGKLDKSLTGGKDISFFCAKRRDEWIFTLHISVMSSPYDVADEKPLRDCVKTFLVNFDM
jgi:hypothetical protein